jgi:hypothetical protein
MSLTDRLCLAACPMLLAAVAGCAGSPPTAPAAAGPALARGGNGGGGSGGGATPGVDRTDPESAPQGVTLDVRVLGSNYDGGSRVTFLLDGSATPKVRTNATTFVSPTELIANITIAVDAQPDRYDVQVTASGGKKGIGIELFAVTAPPLDLATLPADPVPAGLYQDGLGMYLGAFNVTNGGQGNRNYNVVARCEEGRAMDLRLPAGWTIDGVLAVCDWTAGARNRDGQRINLHIPDLWAAECANPLGCPVGAAVPGGSNFAPTLNYYFVVDADRDGKFQERGEPAYNVVWTDGTFAVAGRAGDGTPCRYQVSARTATLWLASGILAAGSAPVRLDAVVTRVDGPCGAP